MSGEIWALSFWIARALEYLGFYSKAPERKRKRLGSRPQAARWQGKSIPQLVTVCDQGLISQDQAERGLGKDPADS